MVFAELAVLSRALDWSYLGFLVLFEVNVHRFLVGFFVAAALFRGVDIVAACSDQPVAWLPALATQLRPVWFEDVKAHKYHSLW